MRAKGKPRTIDEYLAALSDNAGHGYEFKKST